MDRMIYTAMGAAKQAMNQQAVINHNLANVATSGFRAQLHAMRAVPVGGAGVLPTRVSVAATTPGTDYSPGPLESTGRGLDIALEGNGWLAVQAPDGSEVYTRYGALRVDGQGVLMSNGHPVLGEGGPIVIPLGADVFIGNDGSISVLGEGQAPDAVVQVDRLKLVDAGGENLLRGDDGLFRVLPDPNGIATALEASEGMRLVTGALEGSNVSPVEGMVAMIANARHYDMQMKVISSADDNAQRGNSLLSLR